MGTTAEKLSYLNTTKTKIKDVLNLGGANITNETFRQYVDKIKDRYLYYMLNGTQVIWNNWNKVSGTGTSLTLNNTENAPMSLTYKGNTSQEGTTTPTSPQDIHVVSGDNSIEVVGKNLLSIEDITNITGLTNNGDSITLNGTPASTSWTLSKPFTLKANTTYALSLTNYIDNQSSTDRFILRNGSTNITQIYFKGGNVLYTPTQDTIIDTLRIFTTGGYTFSNYTFSIQLEVGTTSTTYEQYQGASYPISLGDIELCKIGTYQDKIDKSTGKNLFDGEMEEGTISFSNGQNASSTTKLRSVNYIPVNPETTYYRLFNTTSSDGYLYYYDKNKTLLSTLWYNASVNGAFTTPANCYYLRFITPLNSNPLYMISLGNEVPVYEPYGTGWYLKKEIGKGIIDGITDGKKANYTYTYQNMLGVQVIGFIPNTSTRLLGMSDYSNKVGSYYSSNSMWLGVNDRVLYWLGVLDILGFTTVEQFNTWASTNQPIVYYVLSTPTYTEITDTTLLSQLEALKKSYENVTNISQVNNDLPFELDVTALSNQ